MKRFKKASIFPQNGISLIEILTAIAIVGIITSALITLYMTSDRIFRQVKVVADRKRNNQTQRCTIRMAFSKVGQLYSM